MAIQTAPLHSGDVDAPTAADVRATANAGASEKTLLVLEAALTHSRFTEVVEATGLAKATTHRILGTLVGRQFVTLDADGNYLPGPKILSLAGMALQRIDISAIVRPFVDELVAKSRCTVHLGVVNGDEIIYLIRADSDRPYVMPSRVGLAIPMHSTGIGKVVLGSRADDELERFVVRAGLPARTEHTITSLERLRTEIADVRRLGYALDREENVPGLGCVAAPIRDHTGTVKYGVSITTLLIEHTLKQIEAMSVLAIEAAANISVALGTRPDPSSARSTSQRRAARTRPTRSITDMTNATTPAAFAESLFSLEGKLAVVTGASQGIGLAIAECLASAGANIIGVSYDMPDGASDVRTVVERAGRTFTPLCADFSVREQVTALASDLAGRGVDILINNAGTIRRTPAADHTDEDFDYVVDVNLRATFIFSREVGRTMMERGHGKIVNTASLLSFQGGVNVPGYTSSKSAVAGLTKALANEWAAKGVNVNAVAPGYVSTANTHDLRQDAARSQAILERIPADRWAEASDIAGAVLFLCSQAADYVHGVILPVDGGWLAR